MQSAFHLHARRKRLPSSRYASATKIVSWLPSGVSSSGHAIIRPIGKSDCDKLEHLVESPSWARFGLRAVLRCFTFIGQRTAGASSSVRLPHLIRTRRIAGHCAQSLASWRNSPARIVSRHARHPERLRTQSSRVRREEITPG